MSQHYIPMLRKPGQSWSSSKTASSANARADDNITTYSYLYDNFCLGVSMILTSKHFIVWAGANAKKCIGKDTNLYHLGLETTPVNPPNSWHLYSKQCLEFYADFTYLCNHSKKEYVVMAEYLAQDEQDFWVYHPLPLLTCEGYGKEEKEYFWHMEDAGIWARNCLSYTRTAPEGYTKEFYFFSGTRW